MIRGYLVALKRLYLFLAAYVYERLTENRTYFKEPATKKLFEAGFYKIPSLLSDSELMNIDIDFEEKQRAASIKKGGQENGRAFSTGLLSKVLEPFVEKQKSTLDDYFGVGKWQVELSYYQRSVPQDDVEDIPGGEFHVDDNKTNIKYFIYLSDVNANNGPFSCVPLTHRWRLKNSFFRGLHWAALEQRKSLYGLGIDESEYRLSEVCITGKRGTQFLVDTTGLHRALPLISGERKVAVISFNRK